MQNNNTPTSYFFSIAHSYSIDEFKRHYEDIKHIEPTLEEIHNYLPNPLFFDEVVELYISSYNTSEYILEKLKTIEESVLFALSYFTEETREIQNLFLDGFFTLFLFNKELCEQILKFIKEISTAIPYVKEFSIDELRNVFKIAHYYSHYPKDQLRSFDSYRFSKENERILFDEHELFLHLFVDQSNPVLLTDKFFSLKTSNDFEVLHLLLNRERNLNTATLQLNLSDDEYELLLSENHPPLFTTSRVENGVESALNCVKGLLSINLPREMIYRIYFDTNFSLIRLSNENIIAYTNEYIDFLERQPTLREIYSLLKFQSDIPVDRKYPLFTNNEVRYLYKKEMTRYFKDNLAVFSENCQFCQSLSGTQTIHLEWMDLNKKPHYANYCTVCLEAKNFKYMAEFDCPF